MKFEPQKDIKRIIVIVIASFLMALNIKTACGAPGLFPGGATGLTLLFQRAGEMFFRVEIPYTVLNVAINAVPVYIGFRFIGKKFTLFSGLSIVLTSVLTDSFLPGYDASHLLRVSACQEATALSSACAWRPTPPREGRTLSLSICLRRKGWTPSISCWGSTR